MIFFLTNITKFFSSVDEGGSLGADVVEGRNDLGHVIVRQTHRPALWLATIWSVNQFQTSRRHIPDGMPRFSAHARWLRALLIGSWDMSSHIANPIGGTNHSPPTQSNLVKSSSSSTVLLVVVACTIKIITSVAYRYRKSISISESSVQNDFV